LQGHEFDENLTNKLKIILLKFARLPREIPEINKVMLRNVHLYVNDIKIKDIKVNIANLKLSSKNERKYRIFIPSIFSKT